MVNIACKSSRLIALYRYPSHNIGLICFSRSHRRRGTSLVMILRRRSFARCRLQLPLHITIFSTRQVYCWRQNRFAGPRTPKSHPGEWSGGLLSAVSPAILLLAGWATQPIWRARRPTALEALIEHGPCLLPEALSRPTRKAMRTPVRHFPTKPSSCNRRRQAS